MNISALFLFRFLNLVLFILINLEFFEAKKSLKFVKKGLKIVKKTEKLFLSKAKKAKKALVIHKHKHKKDGKPVSTTTAVSMLIQPTATTFTNIITPSEILMTVTDYNYNYFFGYPTNIPGYGGGGSANLYRGSRFLIAGQKEKCDCCDNKIIVVTKAPEDTI